MKVKIISGAYGYRPVGSAHPTTIMRGETCDVTEEEANRLLSIGAAEIAEEAPTEEVITAPDGKDESKAGEDTATQNNGTGSKEDAHLDPDQLSEMKFDELKQLAEDMGIDTKGMRSKASLIDAIVAVEVTVDEEDDGEQPPDLTAAAPVV